MNVEIPAKHPPAKHPPGTIWLDAPEVMEVGKTYEVPVMVEVGKDAELLYAWFDLADEPCWKLDAIDSPVVGIPIWSCGRITTDSAGNRSLLARPDAVSLGSGSVHAGEILLTPRCPSEEQTTELRVVGTQAAFGALHCGAGTLRATFHPTTIRIVEPDGE